jgi:hypothetical protein
VPLQWATTQNNLGDALRTLGERGTRERMPLDWAGTQNNLGLALRVIGERESGTARLGFPPIARPCRKEPASGCRSNGP